MAKYKCPSLGDCDKANSGEIFERSPGEDLKCPGCSALLDLQMSAAPARGKKTIPVMVGSALVFALIGTGAYFFMKPAVTATGKQAGTTSTETAIAPAAASRANPSTAAQVENRTTVGIAPSNAETKELRQQSDTNLIKGDAAQAESASSKAAANEMLKVAIAKMAQGKLDEAEKDLNEARVRSPKGSLVYYNMGILRLKQNRVDDALKEFEASFMSGFSYFDKMDQDRDLDELRKNPRFAELLTKYRALEK